jgi:hypothetical protein
VVALDQQQPCPLRGDRVEQSGHARAGRGQFGLSDRFERPAWITVSLPDPGQGSQARGQRRGVDELAAQREAFGDMPQGRVELVPLVGHLGQAHVPGARTGHGRAAGRPGDRQRPLIGVMRRVQAALGALNLAEVIAHHRG